MACIRTATPRTSGMLSSGWVILDLVSTLNNENNLRRKVKVNAPRGAETDGGVISYRNCSICRNFQVLSGLSGLTEVSSPP